MFEFLFNKVKVKKIYSGSHGDHWGAFFGFEKINTSPQLLIDELIKIVSENKDIRIDNKYSQTIKNMGVIDILVISISNDQKIPLNRYIRLIFVDFTQFIITISLSIFGYFLYDFFMPDYFARCFKPGGCTSSFIQQVIDLLSMILLFIFSLSFALIEEYAPRFITDQEWIYWIANFIYLYALVLIIRIIVFLFRNALKYREKMRQ